MSRDRDLSRGDKTRDWTRDGKGEQKRDWSANKDQRPLAQRHPRADRRRDAHDRERDRTRGDFARGRPITPELTAMRLLGGGSAYEACLAFDEITYAPVVVKVVRPGQVTDESSLRGLRREVEALAAVNHPVVVRGLRHDVDGPAAPRRARAHRRAAAVDAGPALRAAAGAAVPPLAIEIASALHYFRHVGYVHLDIKPSNIIMGAPARLIDLSRGPHRRAAAGLRYADRHRRLHGARAVRAAGRPARRARQRRLGSRARRCSRRSRGTRPSTRATAHAEALAERLPAGRRRRVRAARPASRPRSPRSSYAALGADPGDRPLPHEIAEALRAGARAAASRGGRLRRRSSVSRV